LLKLENGREELTAFGDALQHLSTGKREDIFSGKSGFDFLPCEGRRNSGGVFGAQRINRDRGFLVDVLTPVHEDFSAPEAFGDAGHDEVREAGP
jgi:hypothetical protein